MKAQVDKRLVDETIDAYVYWREACAELSDAYQRWTHAPNNDAADAFSAYQAALDREECASHAYANLVTSGHGVVADRRGLLPSRTTSCG